MRKRIIYVLIMSLIIILLLIGIKYFLNKKNNTEENIIDLNKYTNDVTINEGGEYTITGEFKYSIVVSTNDKVVLNLNNRHFIIITHFINYWNRSNFWSTKRWFDMNNTIIIFIY